MADSSWSRVVELTDELVDVELVDRAAQQRPGREGAVDGPVRDRGDDRLDDAGQIGLLERFREELGHLGQAALAVEPVHGVAEAGLERGGRVGIQRARVREREHEALAGDAEPARGAVEAEQDDPLGDGLQLRRERRNRARGARIGRPARHEVTAARGDLDAEDGRHEQHGDERQGERPHDRLRSRSASAGTSASSASSAATRNAVRNARVAARSS